MGTQRLRARAISCKRRGERYKQTSSYIFETISQQDVYCACAENGIPQMSTPVNAAKNRYPRHQTDLALESVHQVTTNSPLRKRFRLTSTGIFLWRQRFSTAEYNHTTMLPDENVSRGHIESCLLRSPGGLGLGIPVIMSEGLINGKYRTGLKTRPWHTISSRLLFTASTDMFRD